MQIKPKLNPKVLDYLREKLGIEKSTIRSEISRLKRNFPEATLNAVAQIYASKNRLSVRRLISVADKKTLPNVQIEKKPQRITVSERKVKNKLLKIIDLESSDHFVKAHIAEINKAYTYGCFTCVFVIVRKLIENLVFEILRTKYPPVTKQNRELYYDLDKNRNKDFDVILKTLYDKRDEFEINKKKAIERLNQKVIEFKKDANDKTHSLFHIVESKKEIDDLHIDTIIELINKIK